MTPAELREATGLYARLSRLRGWSGFAPHKGTSPRLSAPEKGELFLIRQRLEELGMTQLDRRIDETRPEGPLSPEPPHPA